MPIYCLFTCSRDDVERIARSRYRQGPSLLLCRGTLERGLWRRNVLVGCMCTGIVKSGANELQLCFRVIVEGGLDTLLQSRISALSVGRYAVVRHTIRNNKCRRVLLQRRIHFLFSISIRVWRRRPAGKLADKAVVDPFPLEFGNVCWNIDWPARAY